jgi:membrane fusion protein (multidrug efflux system)
MSGFRARSVCMALMLAAAAPLLAGCDEPNSASAAAQSPEPDVSVVTVKPHPLAMMRELPGRVAPTRVADVRPRVSGIVIQRMFRQGSTVKAGDPLYQIDPRPFEVEVQANDAALARAEAVLQQASQQARRVATLTGRQVVSEAEHEKAVAGLRQAEADVEGRKADLARAKLNLDYATIRAPIDGVVGAALMSEGSLVVQNDATSLATIQQLDPIYADFTQSANELSQIRRAFENGDLERISPDAMKVRLVLDDGSVYPLAGKLLFSEAKVDANTGQVTLRGEFPNPKHELLPGMYVRVQIEQGIDSDAIAVPQQAIQRDNGGGSEVFVVKDDDRVAVQDVRTGSQQDGQWLVTDGLKQGDRVVVEGFQKFAAGDKVKPRIWKSMDTATATPSDGRTADQTYQ